MNSEEPFIVRTPIDCCETPGPPARGFALPQTVGNQKGADSATHPRRNELLIRARYTTIAINF